MTNNKLDYIKQNLPQALEKVTGIEREQLKNYSKDIENQCSLIQELVVNLIKKTKMGYRNSN